MTITSFLLTTLVMLYFTWVLVMSYRVKCMVLYGVPCYISLLLDSEKNQAHHHDQNETLSTRIYF